MHMQNYAPSCCKLTSIIIYILAKSRWISFSRFHVIACYHRQFGLLHFITFIAKSYIIKSPFKTNHVWCFCHHFLADVPAQMLLVHLRDGDGQDMVPYIWWELKYAVQCMYHLCDLLGYSLPWPKQKREAIKYIGLRFMSQRFVDISRFCLLPVG